MNPQETSGVKTWQWVVTVVVIIVLIIIGIMVVGNKSTDMTNDDTATATSTDMATTGANRIVVSDQYPGNVVYLSSVQLTKGGWVNIHKDNAGVPGEIIGSAYFEAGINPGKITLTKSTVEGGTYYAMLHNDDGDKKFDATKDLPLKDSKDNMIMKIFRATVSATTEIKG